MKPTDMWPHGRPSRVWITGSWWKIKYNTKDVDSSFSAYKKEISVGAKYNEIVPDGLMHEIFEAILTERGHRYDYFTSGNDKRMFVFNHWDMHLVVLDLVGAIDSLSK